MRQQNTKTTQLRRLLMLRWLLQLRWLRLAYHVRATTTHARALRVAVRALSVEPVPARGFLCGREARVAA
jgi:hypothetical protein